MKSYKNIAIYYGGYITFRKVSEFDNIKSVNPLYQMINEVIRHTEEKNRGKYLALSPDNELMDKQKEI